MIGDDNRDGDQPETSNPTPLVPPPTQQIPHTVSSIKLPILKKGEYDIWAMKMEHYLSHTGYPIWKVIQNGNGLVSVTTDTNGMIKVLPPKTAEEVVAKERERKAMTTLLMALLEDHLAKFHKMLIQRRCTTTSSSSNTHNVAFVSVDNTSSTNDVSTAYSVSSPSVLKSQKEGSSSYTDEVAMISIRIKKFYKRTGWKLQFDSKDPVHIRKRDGGYSGNKGRDNGRRPAYQDDSKALVTIEEEDIDWSGHVEDDTQNYAMMAYSSSNSGSDNEINDDDLEEMDLKWQVAMISMRIKKFHKRTGRKLQFDTRDTVGFDKTKVECFNCHKMRHFARDCRAKWNQDSRRRDGEYNGNKARDNSQRPASQDDSKALVTIDGEAVDWSGHTSVDESNAKTCENASCEFDSSVETTTSIPTPVENAPKVVCEPKVWTYAPIIKEYELDSDDDSMFDVQENIEKPTKRTLSWWLVAVEWGNLGKGVAAGGVGSVGGEMDVVERQPWRWWSASVRDGGDGCGCGVAVLVVTVSGTKGGVAASGGE
nr:ribonuclease H-like domain-containing protein [Tanacetum cinerariifolium]